MKLHGYTIGAIFFLLVQGELICKEDIGCYDSQFKPSSEWQIVKEGQTIPPGLHVRLNLETGSQEAKYLLDDDEDENINNVAVVVPQKDGKAETKKSAKMASNKPLKKSKVDPEELMSFSSSVDEILKFDEERDISRLSKALDTLIDLSHDIEFGAELTKDKNIFASMKQASDLLKTESPELVEKIFRVMGSSLRNNEQSIENFLLQQPLLFIDDLYELLNDTFVSDIIHKRVLGVIQALSSNAEYAKVNFSLDEGTFSGLQKLFSAFPHLGIQAQERLVQMLEDLPITGFDQRTFGGTEKALDKMSRYLQLFLVNEHSRSEEQFKSVTQALVQLHKKNRLTATHEFLVWLSKEVEERRTGLKKRSLLYSGTDPDFDSFLKSARHAVFGNSNAERKMGDEL